jgi:molybdopterin-binding protein
MKQLEEVYWMQDLYWECKVCEACGVCGKSEEECRLYDEYYGFGKSPGAGKAERGSLAVLERDARKLNQANQGIINRLNGRIVKVIEGESTALLTIAMGEHYISSMMPLSRFRESGKKIGDLLAVAFKSIDVKVMN